MGGSTVGGGCGVYVGSVGGSRVGRELNALLVKVGGTVAEDTCPEPERSQFTLPISTSPTRIQRRSFIIGHISAPEYQNDAGAPIESVATCPTGRGTGQNGPPSLRRSRPRAVFFSQALGCPCERGSPSQGLSVDRKTGKTPDFQRFRPSSAILTDCVHSGGATRRGSPEDVASLSLEPLATAGHRCDESRLRPRRKA